MATTGSPNQQSGRRSERIFAVGDIHGRFDKLTRLMTRLPYDPARDTLIFLGDYIDRGAESAKVIELICGLQEKGREVIALMGNHEHLLLEYHRTGDDSLLPLLRRLDIEATMEAYGRATLADLRSLAFLPSRHRRFLEGLKPFWETDEFIFVHAGLAPGIPPAEQDIGAITTIRDLFLTSREGFGKQVIFGHTPFETPLVTPTRIGIDTGAAYGGLLTAVELPALSFHHAR
ncbi:MAG: metallophosphoesterase family protein [Deltaproteobacteria bacterium]|jgi:serine/threonine protein phosphatase 1